MAAAQTSQQTRPGGPLLWLHAPPAEAQAEMAELLRHMADRRPDLNVLVTGRNDLPDSPEDSAAGPPVLRAAAPGEELRAVSAFLDLWRPDLALFYPAHLPPTALAHAAARGIGLFLIVPALPAGWRNRWRMGAAGTRRLLRRFDRVFLTAPEGAAPLAALGVPRERIAICKPFAQGSAALPCNTAERDALAALMGWRPVWLAAGTHPPEDPVVVAAHTRVLRHAHRLLLILVPDDPGRGPLLARRLRALGWDVALRSADEDPEPEVQIYIADTEGEMGLWLRLSPVSFLGGTLGAEAGPDPYQAAALGSAILYGPAAGALRPRYERLARAGAARLVRNEASLAEAVSDLLAPERAAVMARNAWDVATEGAMSTMRAAEGMIDLLAPEGGA